MPITISITPDIEYKLGRAAAIQEGLDDIEAGRVEDHDDVINEILADIHKIIADKQNSRPTRRKGR